MSDHKTELDPSEVPEPPTIEVPHGEALAALMAKPEYTQADIDACIAYARERRRKLAAKELEKKLKANRSKKPKGEEP